MFLFMLGMLVCVGLAIVIIALIASPSFREGERFFTPEGEERVQNVRRRASQDAARGRDAVRSVVSRRRTRDTEDADLETEEGVDVPAGPDYRVSDMDAHEEVTPPADREVKLAAPGADRARRGPSRPDPVEAAGEQDEAVQRDGADDEAEATVDLRDPRPDEGSQRSGSRAWGRRPEAAVPAAAGAVAAGATAIAAVGRGNRRTDRDDETRFDLPAVSRHEEAYEDAENTAVGVPAVAAGPDRTPPEREEAAARPVTARTTPPVAEADAADEPWSDELDDDDDDRRPRAGRAAGAEGGFMTRITGSLSRSGTDRTRTGPRHARAL